MPWQTTPDGGGISRIKPLDLTHDVTGPNLALSQMQHGFGGMLAFDVSKTDEDALPFIAALKTIRHAVSLGSTESLPCTPCLTTMLYLPPERRMSLDVNKNTAWLSVGIEAFGQL